MPPRRMQPTQPQPPTAPAPAVSEQAPEIRETVAAAQAAEAAPKPVRNPDGTFKAGGPSANPGGRTKTQRAFRRAMVERLPNAFQLLDELGASEKPADRRLFLETVLDRAMGKKVRGAELPDLKRPKVAPGPVSTGSLLEAVRSSLAQGVAQFQQKQAAGELSMEDLVLLGQLSSTLASLAKEERSQREEGEERHLAELAKVVRWLEGLPPAERQSFFEKIQGARVVGSGEQAP
jgi:hypothetical protein